VSDFSPQKEEQKIEEQIPFHDIQSAIANYEDFHKLPPMTVTVDVVRNSELGLRGWADYEPENE
jgi:hypothetical protein